MQNRQTVTSLFNLYHASRGLGMHYWIILILLAPFVLNVQAQTQGVLREVWRGIPGTQLQALYDDPRFPDQPDFQEILTNGFEAPTNVDDSYGQRLRAILTAPQTGEYIFWIASDDEGVLFLSTDELPEHKRQIAAVPGWTAPRQWNKYPQQRSEPIRLIEGRRYYIEALMKEGGGGDNLAVRWQLPDGTIEEPIPAHRLKPFGMGPPNIVQHPHDLTVIEGRPARFEVVLQNIGTMFYQWQRNGQDIPGATNAVYEIPFTQLSDDGAVFRVRVWNEEGSAISEEATLTVLPDTEPPLVVGVVNLGTSIVVVTFSERVDPLTATDPANYAISPSISIHNATLAPDEKSVFLETDELTFLTTYTLTVNNVRDRAASPNTIAPNTQVQFIATDLTPATIGQPAFEPVFEPLEHGYRVTAAGSDFDATADEGFFAYRRRTGDFDVRVQINRLDYTGDWAKAALMVREDLSPTSRYVAAVATPSISGCFMLFRPATASPVTARGSFPVNYPFTWLRLERNGTQFTAYASLDGELWTELGSQVLTLPSDVYVGIAVSSESSSVPTTVEFSHFEEVSDTQTGLPRWTREPIGPCTRRTGLVISEIHYHPAPRDDGRDIRFIELCNAEPVPEDLSGYRLDGDIHFVFPEGTVLRGGEFLIVAAAPDDLHAVYGQLPVRVLGPWEGQLSKSAGTVQLWHRNNGLLIDIHYDSRPPWPVAPNGTGHTLVLARPSYGAGDVRAWEASTFRGGSPGQWDPIYQDSLNNIVINELLANPESNQLDWLELFNRGTQSVDLSGCFLTDEPDQLKYQFPNGTLLGPGEFLVLDETVLGFGLSRQGETVYLISPDQQRVLQAVRFPAQEQGISWGRYPDGAPELAALESATPGAPNTRFRTHDVVINEIMFNPISGDDDDEYIELYNKGTEPVNLSGWQFTRGINFTFPRGTILQPGSYLVIAKNRRRLLEHYPHLTPSEVLGDYTGRLSNDGELVTLAKPLDPSDPESGLVPVDEVFYRDGGRWCLWANRGGSSLELIDPASDNRRPDNWADSDETQKSRWVLIEHTGVLDNGRGTADELHILLLGRGECLIDDVEVIPQGGANVVPNGGFENGLQGWIIQGTHVESGLSDEAYTGAHSLHLRASGGGDNGANRIEVQLTTALQPGSVVTIRARARWLAGHTNLLLRLKGNWLEAVGSLPVPADLGTPGRPNSRLVQNAGPSIWQVTQFPILPRAGTDPVTVTARIDDPDGVQRVILRYRVDPSTTYRSVLMTDDGSGADERAGDGIYTAQIPAQGNGALIAYRIEATDALGARSVYPSQRSDEEALIRWGEPVPFGNFGTYRMWFTQATVQEWSRRPVLSNHGLPGTFVYGQWRVIHNIRARYRGSPFIRPRYNGPTGSLCAYVFEVPADEPLLGAREFNLDWLEQPGRDPTFQCEHTSFWIAEQLGLPISHQAYIYLYVNGMRRGQVYTDSLHVPSGDYIPCWFATQQEGELYKIDDWFEFDDNVNREFNVNATLQLFTTTNGEKKKARYRWNWEKKANNGLDDDYTSLFVLVDAANAPDGQTYTRALENIADMEQWMRTFALRHIVCDWDGYGYNRGKNMFMYLPKGDRFKMLLWDLDFSLGHGSDGPNTSIWNVNDPTVARMYNHPPFRRAYLQAIYDAVTGPLLPENMNPLLDALYREFLKNRVQAQSPASIKSWVAQRRSYLMNVINQEATAQFRITTNNGQDFETDRPLVELQGTAPLSVVRITVNGKSYPIQWSSVTAWSMNVPLSPGPNTLAIRGWNRRGEPIPDAEAEIRITYNGEDAAPEQSLVINEIHYHAAIPGSEFIEIVNISSTHAFDLSGYRLMGTGFEFPPGTLIGPNQYLVVVKDRVRFGSAFNIGLPIAGVFPGNLRNEGELIELIAPTNANALERIIDRVRYSNRPPWPTEADGLGPSLQLIDPTRPNESVANWAVAAPQAGPQEVTLVPIDQVWRYNQTEAFYDTSWTAPDYDDSAWPQGPALLFVENADLPAPKNTELTLGRLTYYFRTEFTNSLPEGVPVRLYLRTVVDDSVAVYLNGKDLFRLGLPEGVLTYDTLASRVIGNATWEGVFELPADALQPARNVLAAEVHQHSPTSSDIVFGLELVARTDTQRLATPGQPNSVRASLPEFPPLWLNELDIHNIAGLKDNYGESDPWLELYNAGDEPISLEGFYLTDTFDNLRKWAFPAGTTIEPHGYLIVWMDAQPTQTAPGFLHATVRPVAEGGVILLCWETGQTIRVLDYLEYPALPPSRAFGRFPDGEPFGETYLAQATPATANTLASPPVRIYVNEWMASNTRTIQNPVDGTYSDWFELYNPESVPVDLTGYMLSDQPNDPDPFIIPSGYAIPAGGFLVVWADGHPEYNQPGSDLHVSFRLNNNGESIVLLGPDRTVIDSVTFGPQTDDISQGRFPDGSQQITSLQPTPGAPNRPLQTEQAPRIDLTSSRFDQNGVFHVVWSSIPGRTYRVEYTDQLPPSAWQLLGEYTAEGEITAADDPNALQNAIRFYRVILLPSTR